MELQVGYTDSANYKCLEDLQRDYVDLYLSYCGIENCEAGFGFGPNTRTEYVIHVITKGRGFFQVGKEIYPLEKDQAFLITPGVESYYEADKEDPWSYIWIGFNGLKSYECISNAGFSKEEPTISINCTDKLISCISQMLDARQLTYANELKRGSLLMQFMAFIIEDYSLRDQEHINYDYSGAIYVKHAINFMSHNYSKKIKINDLANYIGINRSYLTNSFKKAMGVSPQEFLVTLRMNKAASLLQKTALPISTIATQVGYDDPLAFSKIFKQKYSVSPKAFREMPEQLVTLGKKNDYVNVRSL